MSINIKGSMMNKDLQYIFLGGGCFWGVEYLLSKLDGVINTQVGYCGGHTIEPTYKEVCNGYTGHIEVVKVLYDPNIIAIRDLLKYFFEIHNFSQRDGQGLDIGEQYLSRIFYTTEEQKKAIEDVINILLDMNYHVETKFKPYANYWVAEDYHQQYFDNNTAKTPCHLWKQIFTKD